MHNLIVSKLIDRGVLVSVAHCHSARWAWNGYQPGLGSNPRPGRI